MILNKILNKKQLVVAWAIILLVSVAVMRTSSVLTAADPCRSIRMFHYLYFFILIFGVLIIYALRDKKK